MGASRCRWVPVGAVGCHGFPCQARMERDLSNRKLYAEEELPESGAGSEFHRRLREEARRKKHGIVLREFRPEDQPWLLRVNGKNGRRSGTPQDTGRCWELLG